MGQIKALGHFKLDKRPGSTPILNTCPQTIITQINIGTLISDAHPQKKKKMKEITIKEPTLKSKLWSMQMQKCAEIEV